MREKKAVPQKVFPAQAGVILLPLEMENDLKGFPRASGGDPTFLLPLLPVSYTHLDVYKRQEYGAAKLNGEISESSNKLRLFTSYAGQGKTKITYAQATRWLLYINGFDDTSSKPKVKGLPSPGAGWLGKLGLITVQAVSYTHLDVYKRQGQSNHCVLLKPFSFKSFCLLFFQNYSTYKYCCKKDNN